MAVKIGHAVHDENGKASKGKAGDQTKQEVATRNYYNNTKGWRVFRAKDATIAEQIAKCMEDSCENDNIGYDQYERNTLYNAVKNNNFKCDKSSLTKKVECDCSSLVRVCLAYAGINTSDFNTASQANVILGTGKFIEVETFGTGGQGLKRGDILVTKTKGHTAIVLTNGAEIADTTQPKADSEGASSQGSRVPYLVKITAYILNIRRGPGIMYKINGTIKDRGVYTIVEEKAGWGRLKSGAGWISLKWTKRI